MRAELLLLLWILAFQLGKISGPETMCSYLNDEAINPRLMGEWSHQDWRSACTLVLNIVSHGRNTFHIVGDIHWAHHLVTTFIGHLQRNISDYMYKYSQQHDWKSADTPSVLGILIVECRHWPRKCGYIVGCVQKQEQPTPPNDGGSSSVTNLIKLVADARIGE